MDSVQSASSGISIRRATQFTRVLGIAVWLLVIMWGSQSSALAQQGSSSRKWHPWHFEPHSYYDPLAAEPRSAETKILFLGRGSSVPFALNPGQSFIWDISVGAELPIVGMVRGDKGNRNSPVAAREFGFGLWIPVSFHLLEDMGKDPSNPILDTDYRFGGMVKAQYGLGDLGGMHSSVVGLRYVPIAHESTHIGDEFTVGAIRKYPSQFQRVNVSYQYYEIGSSFETDFFEPDTTGTLHTIFRAGFIREAFHNGIGWYDTALLYPDGASVTASNRNYEPYLGAEAFYLPARGHMGPFVSVDNVFAYASACEIKAESASKKVQLTGQILPLRSRRSALSSCIACT